MGRIENTDKYPLDTEVELTDYVIGTHNIGEKKRTRNYMILDMFRAFQSYAGSVNMTLADIDSLTYDYYGGEYGKDNDWVVIKYLKSDINQKTQATFGLNMTIQTLTDAWTNRETLIYT